LSRVSLKHFLAFITKEIIIIVSKYFFANENGYGTATPFYNGIWNGTEGTQADELLRRR